MADPTPAFTQIVFPTDSSPPYQPVMDIAEEVDKPTEVDDNNFHHSTDQVQPSPLASSMSTKGETQHMDVDETSTNEFSEQ